MRLFTGLILGLITSSNALASGLDVQLKDLRGSFYYLEGEKNCRKLTGVEIKKYGRLRHCHPQSSEASESSEETLGKTHVTCPTSDGPQMHAFETEELCKASLKTAGGEAPPAKSESTAPAANP